MSSNMPSLFASLLATIPLCAETGKQVCMLFAEEAVLGAAFSLSRPSEPLSSKQRRIAKVIQQIPSGLEAAAATEAAVAAEKKASQAELPTVAKVS